MNRITIYVSSVTNAMRGKAALERQGFSVTVQRSSRLAQTDGCGYSLTVSGDEKAALGILKQRGIRILRTERGGAGR